MGELKWYELMTISLKRKLASIGWKMFIYFNNFTEEEYWEQIYQQEKQHKNEMVKE